MRSQDSSDHGGRARDHRSVRTSTRSSTPLTREALRDVQRRLRILPGLVPGHARERAGALPLRCEGPNGPMCVLLPNPGSSIRRRRSSFPRTFPTSRSGSPRTARWPAPAWTSATWPPSSRLRRRCPGSRRPGQLRPDPLRRRRLRPRDLHHHTPVRRRDLRGDRAHQWTRDPVDPRHRRGPGIFTVPSRGTSDRSSMRRMRRAARPRP